VKLAKITRKMGNACAENIKSFQNFKEAKKYTKSAAVDLDDKYFRVHNFSNWII
jgi:hypothetical protein